MKIPYSMTSFQKVNNVTTVVCKKVLFCHDEKNPNTPKVRQKHVPKVPGGLLALVHSLVFVKPKKSSTLCPKQHPRMGPFVYFTTRLTDVYMQIMYGFHLNKCVSINKKIFTSDCVLDLDITSLKYFFL